VALRRGAQMQRKAPLPCIPGVDCAGTVDAVGPGVSRWKVGDRVVAAGGMPLDIVREDETDYKGPQGMMGIRRPGGFAEYVCVPSIAAAPLPEGLSFHEAAVVMRHCPTAWNLLINVAQLKKDEWVLIMGASGNLGSVGIQIAKHVIGARVITTAGSRARADAGLELGADHAIDYSTQDLRAEIMRITDGKGVNVLYDNIANPEVLPDAFRALGERGRLVTAGAHGGPNVTIDFFHLYDRKITIQGMPGARDSDRPKCFAAAAEGKIKVRIAHVLPLSAAVQAHRMMEADAGMGKIVLDPTMG
jgi:NADPH:quinone reductase-like Zn-dependent oxidoreductase